MEMITVVFSDERVALAVNARFVCVWENKTPSARFPDPNVEKVLPRPATGLPIGVGASNVMTVFATPDGDVLNAVPGNLDVEAFFDEMRLAWAVQRLTVDADGRLKPGASNTFAGLQQAAATLCGDSVPGVAHAVLGQQRIMTLGTSFGKYSFDRVFPARPGCLSGRRTRWENAPILNAAGE
jgi:hypothetical protein